MRPVAVPIGSVTIPLSLAILPAGDFMGDPASGMPPPDQPPEDRLDSWKEIAASLGRDVTTVQRWEKSEAMPVHRHVHDKRSSVYALRSELDSWRQNRKPRLDEDNQPQQENEPAPSAAALPAAVGNDPISTPSAGVRRGRWLAVAAIVWLSLIVPYAMLRNQAKVAARP